MKIHYQEAESLYELNLRRIEASLAFLECANRLKDNIKMMRATQTVRVDSEWTLMEMMSAFTTVTVAFDALSDAVAQHDGLPKV